MDNQDYQQLYNLAVQRRREEQRTLEEVGTMFSERYAQSFQRDRLYCQSEHSKERSHYNVIICKLSELMDAFRETEIQLADCVKAHEEPNTEEIPGETHAE